MPKVAVFDMQGQQVGEMELSERVFGSPVNRAVLHQAIVAHMAGQRQGTAATKSRGMVRGGGRKPWRQKGTGRARAGSIRSPLWRGGGVIFGPQPRSYQKAMPKKVKRLAMRSALSSKMSDQKLLIIDSLDLSKPRTKDMIRVLNALKLDNKALIVMPSLNPNVYLSARNIPGVLVTAAQRLNVYDILHHDGLIITREAVAQLEEGLA